MSDQPLSENFKSEINSLLNYPKVTNWYKISTTFFFYHFLWEICTRLNFHQNPVMSDNVMMTLSKFPMFFPLLKIWKPWLLRLQLINNTRNDFSRYFRVERYVIRLVYAILKILGLTCTGYGDDVIWHDR